MAETKKTTAKKATAPKKAASTKKAAAPKKAAAKKPVSKKEQQEEKTLTIGELTLDLDRLEVRYKDVSVKLTRTECAILRLLMQNEGKPLGRNTILEKISEDTPDCTDRSLKQHISNIRKKLMTLDEKDHIEAIYGIGFKYIS